MSTRCRALTPLLLSSLLIAACGSASPAATSVPATATPEPLSATPTEQSLAPASAQPWVEEEATFAFGSNELFGILTLPGGEGPYPAIVIISGSADPSTGARSGASARYHIDHARQMVGNGFAVLRYDPPGVGQSTGERGFESLDSRTEEAMAAVHYLQSRPDIRSDRIGLWADSQGAWVIAMAAAAFPEDVAFLIAVSGSGVSVAEQQVYSIRAQSQAAGLSEQDIARAVLFGRLLVDWQLADPIYRQVNEADMQALGDGPWARFLALVYEPGEISPAEGLQQGIEILRSIQDEPWARFLYIKELYLPQLESIPPEHVAAVRAAAEQSLLNDPEDYLTRVRCPLLAFFGEDDLLQPTERSAALYDQYLTEAGNKDYTIVVIPGVGHSIGLSTPGYRQALSEWLDHVSSQ
jgi:pimeloyl-ACP methyl ester carboxylesterase